VSQQQDPEADPPSRIVGPYHPPAAPNGPSHPPMTGQDAHRIVSDFDSSYTDRTGRGAWLAAIFGTALALICLLMALPPTAHAMLHESAAPIALLGTLFFGLIAFAGVNRLRKYHAAKRYLREHPGN
jgi:hypothetical protein